MAGLGLRSHGMFLQYGIEGMRTPFAESGEGGAAADSELAVAGVDPGVRELPVARAAGASLGLGAANGRGQSGDRGGVLLAVRLVWGGVGAGARRVGLWCEVWLA